MSSIDKQETGDVLGDDRDFFEEDFAPLVPGSFVKLPMSFDVGDIEEIEGDTLPSGTAVWPGLDARRSEAAVDPVSWASRLKPGTALEWPEATVHLKGVAKGFDYIAFLGRQELDDDQTKETIADLQEHGAVTIIDGKTGLQMDAEAYKAAARQLEDGERYPYDDMVFASPSTDWAHSAVRGAMFELLGRGGIAHALDIAQEAREEIVETLSDIVRAAFIRRAAEAV
ncbi:hypothetical protein [Rhizobium leguminosarum]|uniref:hypothetical protein n=1 Tax=Rhizobium leguminosarum TaxID=384 RepID=UPI003F9B6113